MIHPWVMSGVICVTWHIHMRKIPHSYVGHGSSLDHIVDMTHRTPMGDVGGHMCDMTHSYAEYDSFMGVTWLNHVCHVTHLLTRWCIHRYCWGSYVWHDSFISVTWLIHICDRTHSYVWHDASTGGTWLIDRFKTTQSCVWHDSFTEKMIHPWVMSGVGEG